MLRSLFFRATPEQTDSRDVSPMRSFAVKNFRAVENDRERILARARGKSRRSWPILRGAFTLSKLVLFVIGSPAQFRNRFRSLSNVNRSGSQNASKNAAAAAEKTE